MTNEKEPKPKRDPKAPRPPAQSQLDQERAEGEGMVQPDVDAELPNKD